MWWRGAGGGRYGPAVASSRGEPPKQQGGVSTDAGELELPRPSPWGGSGRRARVRVRVRVRARVRDRVRVRLGPP